MSKAKKVLFLIVFALVAGLNAKAEDKSIVAFIVDSYYYNQLSDEVGRLKNDIENEGKYNVVVYSRDWTKAADVKSILQDEYKNNGLVGAILIGDIPAVYFEYKNSGRVLTDWYYQDFSNNFVDNDGDELFEREYYMDETDVTKREIWTARLKPPVGGAEGTELLRKYFEKNHKYRAGELEYNKKMLYFRNILQNTASREQINKTANQIDEYLELYDNDEQIDVLYNKDYSDRKDEYLSKMLEYYEFLFINTHGSPTSQSIGSSISVSYGEVNELGPNAFYSEFATCSNGNFMEENYFAGWYLFSGDSLVVSANSAVVMLVGAESVDFLKDYKSLNLGVDFGEIYINDRSFLTRHLFGDPTLAMRAKPYSNYPVLMVDTNFFDFENVKRGKKLQKEIVFKNESDSILKISYIKSMNSINGEYNDLGYWDYFNYINETNKNIHSYYTFRDFEIAPRNSEVVYLTFYPREDGPIGEYTMTILFQTNDPNNPYLEFFLVGESVEELLKETNIVKDEEIVNETKSITVNVSDEKKLINGTSVDMPDKPQNDNIVNNIIKINNKTVYSRLKGRIILKVEDLGKAYYIHPQTEKMHYLSRPYDAFQVMREQGIGITNANLEKIIIGNSNGDMSGADTDGDGLTDIFEDAIGTDKDQIDSDGDGYNDKYELDNEYNPNGIEKIKIDNDFSRNQGGKIFLQVEAHGEAWYVNPEDGKRYFLGRPADAFQLMKNLGLGISNADFESM